MCGGEVVQRADDKEDVIRNRLKAYEESTRPLKEHYKRQGPYVEVDGRASSEDVFERVIKRIASQHLILV